jgi:hypothetical protein
MRLTVGQLREILKDIDDALPVVFVTPHEGRRKWIATTAHGTAVIERDTNSHVPVTGRIIGEGSPYVEGGREKVFALYDR